MKSLRRVITTSIRWRVRGEVKAQIGLLQAELENETSERLATLSLQVLELENQMLLLRQVLERVQLTTDGKQPRTGPSSLPSHP